MCRAMNNAPRPCEHPPVREEKMSKRLGGIKGCKYKMFLTSERGRGATRLFPFFLFPFFPFFPVQQTMSGIGHRVKYFLPVGNQYVANPNYLVVKKC